MATDVDVMHEVGAERLIGTIGLGIAIGLAAILGVHPPGSTDLYDDGVEFVEHVSVFWMVIHIAAAALMLGLPLLFVTWGASLRTTAGRVTGKLVGLVSVLGTGLGVLHLVGTDTISFAFYEETLESGETGAAIGADVLLRIHASTLTSWIVAFWLGLPLLGAIAAWVDGRRNWQVYLPAVAAAAALAVLGVTLAERQYTTLSEMVLFRSSATLFIVWVGLLGWTMRRDAAVTGG